MKEISGQILLAKFANNERIQMLGPNQDHGTSLVESFKTNGMIPFQDKESIIAAKYEVRLRSTKLHERKIRMSIAETESDLQEFRNIYGLVVIMYANDNFGVELLGRYRNGAHPVGNLQASTVESNGFHGFANLKFALNAAGEIREQTQAITHIASFKLTPR